MMEIIVQDPEVGMMAATMMAALEVEGLVEGEVAEGAGSGEEGEVSGVDGN